MKRRPGRAPRPAVSSRSARIAGRRSKPRSVLVAFGGNALVDRGEDSTQREQIRRAGGLAKVLARMVARGVRLVLVHGNGPQVGDSLIRSETAIQFVPPLSLDVCVAETQGGIGYFLENALRNPLRKRSGEAEPVTILTQVLVRAGDPNLRRPTKPIGPYFPRYRAVELSRRRGWRMAREEGRGFRRIVPSPRPARILNIDAIEALLKAGKIVIAAGGGGIPVMRVRGALKGVEAVVDKDLTASLLARRLDVDLFVILTDVEGVYEGYGTDAERLIPRMSVARARRGLKSGAFPAGSMGPKVTAAADFASATGRDVLITSVRGLEAGLEGRGGTRVVAR
jgi:carbamate kinase